MTRASVLFGFQQIRLVAAREMKERSRTRAFRASVAVMVLAVVAVIVLPALLAGKADKRQVGLTGRLPSGLDTMLQAQGKAVGTTIELRRYADRAAGETAVRKGKVSVLVVDGDTLEWRRKADSQVQAIVGTAIQANAIRARASSAGITPSELSALLAPVKISSIELGTTAGRNPGDETAAFVMTVLLFVSISTYGSLVLSGVVEEKSSRVVEVLLARIPARTLLAGKIAGIGLLGLGQITLTAVAALIATSSVNSVDVPSVRASVLVWVIVWFVIGYGLYAVVFGALGSLASRAEDAQSAAGPVTVLMVIGYLASFAAIGSPDAIWARAISWFPLTAPLSMPNRIAIGATPWWEATAAALLSIVTIGVLVNLAGRVYTAAILHTGKVMKVGAALKLARN